MDYIALGSMSGTSLDGIDCSIIRSDGISYASEILNEFTPYSDDLKKELLKTINLKYLNNLKLIEMLNFEYQVAINKLISKFDKKIDVIGIHGQTIFHDPSSKISIQLYDKKTIYNSQAPVVCNFRKNDILNGGEGAPILPIYHKIISDNHNLEPCIFVNIGGVTNISIIENKKIKSGDSSFGNAIINDFLIHNTDQVIDEDGKISKKGQIIKELFDLINLDSYFKKKLPKSLDRNYFHKYFDKFNKDISVENFIHTMLSIIPHSISKFISSNKKYKIILSGGGRKNITLVSLFKNEFSDVSLIDDYQLDGDFIESQGMALLAIRYLKKLSSSYKETTGIKKNIYLGEKC